MFYCLFNWFVKLTGWPVQWICFRKKIYYEDRSVQSRHIRGKAIVINNHRSVFDYPLMMFVFWGRTLRVHMSELVMKKPVLGVFLRMLGGIHVDRASHDYGYMAKSERILDKGGVIGIAPEGRIPLKGEATPLAFKNGAAYLALTTDTPIIPMYTNGAYFDFKHRARVIIGTPIIPSQVADPRLSDKENIAELTRVMREKIIFLGQMLHERTKEES
ncbi:lysophospholipid acyltransferase family protein [Ruminococcus sp.]|uniref:lysophospholipid acyltransferase family protein n=1 Tax=Ruminococcus sp. TaxID=41978 RepID=UPI00388FB88C